jgi:NAD(P)-dependent dehydrogenase (short-subunit alcohol dehydrogenase family)
MPGPRVVAITGGARGIGLATARALAADGAHVAIGDLDAAAVHGAAAYPLDVTSPVSFARFVTDVERDLGPLDVLVNNAGVLAAGPVADQPDGVTRRILEVNLLGVITGTKLALRSMLPRRSGHIVNVASLSGETYAGGEAA